MEKLQKQAQDAYVEINALKQAAQERQQQGAAVTRALKSHQAALDALKTRRADLLSTAAMEQVSIRALLKPKDRSKNRLCRQAICVARQLKWEPQADHKMLGDHIRG